MKVGVLQFFSWSRRVPLTAVYERAFSRIAIMDQTGYDCVWLAEHHFNTYSVCPSINVMATHVAARTQQSPDRDGRLAGRVLQPAAPGRRGRADRRAVGRPRELGRRPRVRPRRVRGLRRAGGGELRPLPGVRRDRAGRLAERARELPGTILDLRRHRGPAQAAAGAPPAGVAGGDLAGFDHARGREGLRHPAGSARHPHRHRPQARALLRRPARARIRHRGPGDPDRADARGGRHRPGGRRRGAGRRVVDGGLLRQSHQAGRPAAAPTGSRASIRWSAT